MTSSPPRDAEVGEDRLVVLGDIRALELPGDVATRYCGRLLARLGADVAVQTGANGGDFSRGTTPEAGAAYGHWLDAGKRTIRLPLAGAATAAAVADDDAGFDVVIAGLDPATVAAGEALAGRLEPSPAMLVAISWFSRGGPYEDWTGNDALIEAVNGSAYSFGPSQGPPLLAQGHAPQLIAGANVCNVTLAALLNGDPSRRPRRIDIDVLESSLCLSEVAAVSAIDDPSLSSRRLGVNRFSPTYPCSSYETGDGWVGVTCLTPPQWEALCELIGRTDLGSDPRLRSAYRRLMRADEVDAALVPAFSARTTGEWVSEGLARRIPIVGIPRPGELPGLPHWRRRGAFEPLGGAAVLAPTFPFRVTDRDAVRSARPTAAAGAPLAGVGSSTSRWAGRDRRRPGRWVTSAPTS